MEIALEFRLTPEELVEGMFLYQKFGFPVMLGCYFTFLKIVLMIVLVVLVLMSGGLAIASLMSGNILGVIMLAPIVAGIIALALLFFHPGVVRSLIVFFLYKSNNPFLKECLTVKIDESFICQTISQMETQLDWPSVKKVVESPQIFIIIHKNFKTKYNILPKKAFTDENLMLLDRIMSLKNIELKRV